MNDKCGIYQIRNVKNNKIYIGSSIHIFTRWKKHINLLNSNKHPNGHLQTSWNKYGKENFEFTIIEECNKNILREKEQYYINKTNCLDKNIGYNISPTTDLSVKSKETNVKISNTLKGKYVGEKCFFNKYSENTILLIIEDLKENKLSYSEIAKKYNVNKSLVSNIVSKKSWKYLTKDIIFPDKINNMHSKLMKNDVKKIIDLLIEGKSNCEISEMFNVDRKTISDIRNHKTWISLTNNIIFPKNDNLKRGKDNNNSKLSYDDVKYIKESLKNGVSMHSLAKLFNVSVPAINNIKIGKSYAYI